MSGKTGVRDTNWKKIKSSMALNNKRWEGDGIGNKRNRVMDPTESAKVRKVCQVYSIVI